MAQFSFIPRISQSRPSSIPSIAYIRDHKMLISQTSGSTLAPVRKELLFATIIWGSCATGSLGPLLVPGFVVVAADLQVDLTSVTLLNGSLVMALGVSAYACSCFATCFGKRPVYLFTTMLVLVSCCWAAASKSYSSLIASRVFQGRAHPCCCFCCC